VRVTCLVVRFGAVLLCGCAANQPDPKPHGLYAVQQAAKNEQMAQCLRQGLFDQRNRHVPGWVVWDSCEERVLRRRSLRQPVRI
jgi:hypothetical protein